jgi:predicted amidohydrolase
MLGPVTRDKKPPAHFLCACLQFDVRRGDVAGNLASAERNLLAAKAAGARLAVLPEMWSTSFAPDYPSALLERAREADARLARVAGELEMVVVGSTLEEAGGKVFNRAQVIDGGAVVAEYRKVHLFSPNGEDRTMAAGGGAVVADTSVGRIAVAICYDLRFPELIRWFFYQQAELLALPAQWPEARASHWRALVDARAVENEMFVVACNRTGTETSLKTGDQLVFPGNSRIVDPMGEVLATGNGEEGPVLATVEVRKVKMMRRILPIHRDRRPALYRELWALPWQAGRRRP